MGHVFVYQEWDMLVESKPDGNQVRLERHENDGGRDMSLAARLQEQRLKMRLSVPEFAKKIDVDSRTISMYENGSEMPSGEVMEKVNALLGS